jgi:hypothetical protein
MSGSRRKPGPLGPFVDGYRAWLVGRGYSPSVVVRSLVTLGHLGRWLERNALAVDQLTDEAVSSFLAEYRDDRGRLPGASVWPLLEYLRVEGAVLPEPPAVVAPVEQLVGEYRRWLLCERGLASVTVRASEHVARRFLAQRVDAGDPRGVLGITAGEVNDFLVCECARVSSGHRRSRPRDHGAAWPRGQARCRAACHASRRPSDDPLKEPACRTPDRRAHAQRLVLACDRLGRTLEAAQPRRRPALRHQGGDARPAQRKADADRRPVRAAPAPGGDDGDRAVALEALQALDVASHLQPDLAGDGVEDPRRRDGPRYERRDAAKRRPLGLAVLAIRDVA